MIFACAFAMRNKIKEWLWRYGPAELISLPMTLIPAQLVLHSSGNAVAAAIAGTWGGNIGYFGTILLWDVWQTRRKYVRAGRPYGFSAFAKNLRALVVEFGVAEALDTLLVRPALMYYLPRLLGNFSLGIIIAKFAADLTFYVPAIIFYEWSKKRLRDF
jgi:hypothetical protein